MRALCLAPLAVLFAAAACAQEAPVRAALDRAAAARELKDFPKAAAEFAAADRAAGTKDGTHVEAALKTWADAAAAGSEDQLYACNALGQFYAGRNDLKKAVEAYDRVPRPTGPQDFVYVANHARALERGGDAARALEKYRDSLALEPRYALAAARAVALVTTAPGLTPAQRLDEADKLLSNPKLPAATARSAVLDVLAALPEEWVAGGLRDPVADAALRKFEQSPVVGSWVTELRAVYDGAPFGPTAELFRPGARARFAGWLDAPGGAEDLARLLVRGGNGFRARARGAERPEGEKTEAARQAVLRYAGAFELDRTATPALVDAVATATAHGDRLDPGWKQLDALTRELVGPNSPLPPPAVLTAADHRELSRLAAALNAGNERREMWSGASGLPRSAEFRLSRPSTLSRPAAGKYR